MVNECDPHVQDTVQDSTQVGRGLMGSGEPDTAGLNGSASWRAGEWESEDRGLEVPSVFTCLLTGAQRTHRRACLGHRHMRISRSWS